MKRIFILYILFFMCVVYAGEETFPQLSQHWPPEQGGFYGWRLEYTGTGKFTTVTYSMGGGSTFYPPSGSPFSGNNFANYLTGILVVITGSNSQVGLYGVYTVKTCPDTAYCQKSACGAYCSVHDSGGGTCENTTCSKCGAVYCATHLTHMCFSVTCPEGNNHSFSGSAKKDSSSDVAALQAAYNAAYPQFTMCSICKAQKCSLCEHTCKHGLECVLKNCTVCGVQWCNIHGVVPIYTTCPTCGRMTCNHQTHTCTANDPTNPNQNQGQTGAQTANNTTQTANNTNQIATNTQTTANNTSNIATNTQTTANNTSNIAANTQTTANNTTNISNNTTNISNNTTNISNNTNQIANNTSQMAGALNNIQSGVTNAAAAAQNAADAANAIADKIPDPVENPPSPEVPMESMPDRSGAFTTITEKLLPDFSFFTISGSEFPSWTFNFPLSSFGVGLSDMSFVVGGEAWGTVAEGKLLWLMTLIRGMSYLCFAYVFLMAIIRALRQW